MKFATLSTKQAVIAVTTTAVLATCAVLIATTFFTGPDRTAVDDDSLARTEQPTPPVLAAGDPGSSDVEPLGTGPGLQTRTNDATSGGGSSTPGGSRPSSPGSPDGSTRAPEENASGQKPKPPRGGGPRGSFEIKGSVDGVLYPTTVNTLDVKIENPFNFPIRVASAAVAVGDVGTCSGRHLWFNDTAPDATGTTALPAGQVLPANGELTFSVTAQLQNTAPDSCQNVTFPLSYTGTADKA